MPLPCKNVFINNRGFPDQLDEFDILLHNIDGRPGLRKLKHLPLTLNATNPLFSFSNNKLIHGEHLCKDLDLSHLDATFQQMIYALIRKYWPVFNNHGVNVPVKNYKCIIDTGDMHPIAVKKIHYSPKEIPIMHKAVPDSQMGGGSSRPSIHLSLIRST